MTDDPIARTQRWHDTDHGRGEKGGISCWCCCNECDPDLGSARPNPFWTDATAQLTAGLIR